MFKKFLLTASVLLLCSGGTDAAELPGDSCRNFAGQRINSTECKEWFKEHEPWTDSECPQNAECMARAADRNARAQQRRDRERQATVDALNREEAEAQRRTAAMKAKCGDDYKAPRIGMSISRAQECVAKLRVTAQVNRADGVLTTYEGGNAYFHVMDGRIVAWGRF